MPNVGDDDSMPAPFTASLCGYRERNGNPNTSDNGDVLSKELGRALFEELGVPISRTVDGEPGASLEKAIAEDLRSRRVDLDIEKSRSALEFEQYSHLGVYPDYRKVYQPMVQQMAALKSYVKRLPEGAEARRVRGEVAKLLQKFAAQDEISAKLLAEMPEESLLRVDVSVGRPSQSRSELLAALSCKWSLRTDRAQDCISQGSKLATQRRGPMPHFAVVTIEPRPSMLRILADGSGAIDCVYHLDLPALERAITRVRGSRTTKWAPAVTFDKLVRQRRLRDYDELVARIASA